MPSPGQELDWTTYDIWNEVLVAEFFSGSNDHRPVYIDLEDSALSRIAAAVGSNGASDGSAEFKEAVRETLYSVKGPNHVFAGHLTRLSAWRSDGRPEPPPFVALLSFFSLVAERMQSDHHFRAHNFYGRLAQDLDEDWEQESVRSRLAAQFRRDTPEIWNALRAWLMRHEGRLGIPTAEAFDRREYIGLPMSQALMRLADRKKLPGVFAHYRLRPGQTVAVDDMRHLIEDRLHTSGFSPSLRSLFSRSREAALRIGAVAAIELENWDGVVESDEHVGPRSRTAQLVLCARYRKSTREVQLELAIQCSAGLPEGRYLLQDREVPAAHAAFSDVGHEISVAASEWRSLVAVPESPSVSYPDLLLATVFFRHATEPAVVERNAGRLVAMERDEQQRAYVEVANITLGQDLLLLAHDTIAEQVEAIVKRYARSGWELLRGIEARGLPEDWWLFRKVQFLMAPEFDQERLHELSPLIPVSWSQVTVGGGFSLTARSQWHSWLPLEIRCLTMEAGEHEARVVALDDTGGNRMEQTLGVFECAAVFELQPGDLPDGDYRVFLGGDSQKRTLATATFCLRSADRPRLAIVHAPGWFGHALQLTGPLSALTAEELPERPASTAFVEGLAVRGSRASAITAEASSARSSPDWSTPVENDLEHLSSVFGVTETKARSGELPSCVTTGAHIFNCGSYDPRVPAGHRPPRAGTCTGCGYTKAFPKRRKRTSTARSSSVPADQFQLDLEHVSADLGAVEELDSPTPNALLDALSLERSGSFQSFVDKANQVCEDPWFPAEAAALFSALGHLDFERDPRSLRFLRWRIVTATLHWIQRTRTLSIVGFRSSRLVGRIEEDCEELGLQMQREPNAEGPDRLFIENVDQTVAELLSESLAENLSIPSKVAADSHLGIASLCPRLKDLAESLPEQEVPGGWRIERYAVATNRWEHVREVSPGNAYLFQSHGRRLFGYLPGDGSGRVAVRVADYRTVKYLAAAYVGHSLLDYSPDTEILSARIGSPLPGLYERAAVACSGRVPTNRDVRRCYHSVPASVANALITKLSILGGGPDGAD